MTASLLRVSPLGLRARSIAILVLVLMAGAAPAQSAHPWEGGFAGFNVGGAHTSGCANARLSGSVAELQSTSLLTDVNCSGSALVGGVQFGDNVQWNRMILGIAVDLDAWAPQDPRQALKNAAAVIPQGTYSYAGRLNPSSFAVVGPRIGYAGNLLLPYLTVGAVVTTRSRDRSMAFTPVGAAKPAATFSEGANFPSTGWAAGAGAEIGLNGAWSIAAEVLHMDLGRAASATTTCSGSAALCGGFSGLALNTTHDGFSANVFRIGINYWFGDWEP